MANVMHLCRHATFCRSQETGECSDFLESGLQSGFMLALCLDQQCLLQRQVGQRGALFHRMALLGFCKLGLLNAQVIEHGLDLFGVRPLRLSQEILLQLQVDRGSADLGFVVGLCLGLNGALMSEILQSAFQLLLDLLTLAQPILDIALGCAKLFSLLLGFELPLA